MRVDERFMSERCLRLIWKQARFGVKSVFVMVLAAASAKHHMIDPFPIVHASEQDKQGYSVILG